MINTDERIKRLCQLCLQDNDGYLNAERSEVIENLRAQATVRLMGIAGEIENLDKEYRLMVADKNSDSARRMEIGGLKLELARESDHLSRAINSNEELAKMARRWYGQTKEFQDSIAEQRQIINSIWGTK